MLREDPSKHAWGETQLTLYSLSVRGRSSALRRPKHTCYEGNTAYRRVVDAVGDTPHVVRSIEPLLPGFGLSLSLGQHNKDIATTQGQQLGNHR